MLHVRLYVRKEEIIFSDWDGRRWGSRHNVLVCMCVWGGRDEGGGGSWQWFLLVVLPASNKRILPSRISPLQVPRPLL